MAYTFGGTTGDDLTWTESASPWGATQRSELVCGWYYPTTLTAGRALWSVGAVNRCVIAPTTSEIDIFVDRTTDSQDRTNGLGLTLNRWHFIAILSNHSNTAAVDEYRIWRGYDTEVPVSIPLATAPVAGSGNSTSSTVVTVGNIQATGTSAWQGDIGRFDYVVGTTLALVPNNFGLISDEEGNKAFQQLVIPIWQGKFPTFYGSGTQSNNGITHVVWDLDLVNPQGISYKIGGTILTNNRSATVNAVFSQNRRPIPQLNQLGSFDLRRR